MREEHCVVVAFKFVIELKSVQLFELVVLQIWRPISQPLRVQSHFVIPGYVVICVEADVFAATSPAYALRLEAVKAVDKWLHTPRVKRIGLRQVDNVNSHFRLRLDIHHREVVPLICCRISLRVVLQIKIVLSIRSNLLFLLLFLFLLPFPLQLRPNFFFALQLLRIFNGGFYNFFDGRFHDFGFFDFLIGFLELFDLVVEKLGTVLILLFIVY